MNRYISILSLVGASCLALTAACGSESSDGDTSTGGTTNGGNTGGTNGSTGGTNGNGDGCDLSGAGKERALIPQNPNMTLTSDKVWEIEGQIYVEDGSTLTIEPCTRIVGLEEHSTKGHSVLVVSRGGKIMAMGEPDAPILFTSWRQPGQRRPGDWGGVVLLGRAPNNQGSNVAIEGLDPAPEHRHGGDDPDDSSGVMKYVRIEYPGVEIAPDEEVNGLTFGSVGRGTEIHHIMVSNALDDGFEWFGGTVNAHHLIVSNADDDMFDTDQGYNGELHTLFGRLRYGDVDSRDPNGWECDNNNMNPDLEPVTHVTSSKVTLCGAGPDGGYLQTSNGAVFRRGFTGTFTDQVWLGFHNGVSLRDPAGTPADPRVELTDSMVFANFASAIGTTHDSSDPPLDPVEWFEFEGRNNTVPDPVPFSLDDCLTDGGPSEAVTGSGVGAFKEEPDWMQGLWVDWSEE